MVAPGLGVGVVRELAGEVKVAPTRVLALQLCGAFYLSSGNKANQTKQKQKQNRKSSETNKANTVK